MSVEETKTFWCLDEKIEVVAHLLSEHNSYITFRVYYGDWHMFIAACLNNRYLTVETTDESGVLRAQYLDPRKIYLLISEKLDEIASPEITRKQREELAAFKKQVFDYVAESMPEYIEGVFIYCLPRHYQKFIKTYGFKKWREENPHIRHVG